jgi:hypothetical protein
VFETASWRTENRKHFNVVENIYATAGAPMVIPEEPPDAKDEALFAASLVHRVGSHLLRSVVDVGESKEQKFSNRRSGKAWKQVSADAGTAASVYLTVAVEVLLRPEFTEEGELDQHPIRYAAAIVKQVYDFPPSQWERIDAIRDSASVELQSELVREAVERGGHAAKFAIDMMRMKYSYEALRLAGLDPETMPAFSPVAGVQMDLWSEISSLDWMLTHSLLARAAWRPHEDSFLECAFTPWTKED